MKVFVTGGSGFVGGRLIDALTAGGHTVIGLARSERAAAAVADHGASPVRGDLDDLAALREGMAGADLCVHAAAKLTGDPSEAAEYRRINVDASACTPPPSRPASARYSTPAWCRCDRG